MIISYLPSIAWYRSLLSGDIPVADRASWNTTIISRPSKEGGVEKLSFPLLGGRHSRHLPYDELKLSDHGKWRSEHWNALQTAYGRSPFWEYYQDDFAPFYHERKWEYLKDFNEAIHETILSLLNFPPEGATIYPRAMEPLPDTSLSIIDLLCHKGNEAVLYL